MFKFLLLSRINKAFYFVAIAGFLLLTTSCVINNKRVNGNGKVTTQDRKVGSFEELVVSGSIHVFLSQGPVQAAHVEAESNLLPYIITTKEGDKLKVKLKDNSSISYTHPINVYLTTPEVKKLSMLGSGKIETKDTLTNDEEIKMSVAGSGNIHVLIDAPEVDANIAGSGDINIRGFTRSLDLNIAGSGNFKGSGLKSEEANLKIVGSGSAWVFASVKLSTKIVGSGDVHYRGTPSLDTKLMGSGKVMKDD